MNRYIEQLVDDILQAARHAPEKSAGNSGFLPGFDYDDSFEEIEGDLNAPEEKLSAIVGIPLEMLPAPEKLNPNHLQLVTEALVHLLDAWHFIPELPAKAPYNLKYKALRSIWGNDYPYPKNGYIHIEFCEFDPEKCLFNDFCDVCKEVIRIDKTKRIDLDDYKVRPDDNSLDDMASEVVLKQPVENKFIYGIDHFCDNWCKRCSFTDRCQHFTSMNDIDKKVSRQNDDQDDSSQMDEDQEYDEIGDELDDEFSDVGRDDDYGSGEDFFSSSQKANRHPLTQLSYQYSANTRSWLEQKEKGLYKNLTHWIAKGKSDEMIKAHELLIIYLILLHYNVKFTVALYYDMLENKHVRQEMNGNAKLLLVSIDRSLDEWRILKRNQKQDSDFIRQREQELEVMRLEIEKLFPDARNFIRPGLDE